MADPEGISEHKAEHKTRRKAKLLRWFGIAAWGTLWIPAILGINTLIKDDAPTKRLSFMYSTLTDNFVNGKMHTSFMVTISNGGKSSFQIADKVRAKIWYIPINSLTKGSHVDWEQYMNTTECDRICYTSSYTGEYEAGDSVKTLLISL